MQPLSKRRRLVTLYAELTTHASDVDEHVLRRERPRMPDAQGRPGRGPIDPDGLGAGWGASEQERRTATANLSNALTEAVSALSRALKALDALEALPSSEVPDASAEAR